MDKFRRVLGVTANASKDEIKSAFRRLAVQHHPDKHTEPRAKAAAEKKFKEISEAYSFLTDPKQMARGGGGGFPSSTSSSSSSSSSAGAGTNWHQQQAGGFYSQYQDAYHSRRYSGTSGGVRWEFEFRQKAPPGGKGYKAFDESGHSAETEAERAERAARIRYQRMFGGSAGPGAGGPEPNYRDWMRQEEEARAAEDQSTRGTLYFFLAMGFAAVAVWKVISMASRKVQAARPDLIPAWYNPVTGRWETVHTAYEEEGHFISREQKVKLMRKSEVFDPVANMSVADRDRRDEKAWKDREGRREE
jgi:curved DNA-binding protein CbpA